MGGQSYSSVSIEDGTLKFNGAVEIVPSLAKAADDYDGYYISFGKKRAAGGKFFARGFKATLTPSVGEFGSVSIPFNQFSNFWDDATGAVIRSCEDYQENCPDEATLKNMETMAFWGEGVEGKVNLEVKSVEGYGCASPVK